MVSPLKTWQYEEPRRLWLALGGLSVLAHVGMLGLSLPYILDLIQPAKKSAAATVPIELVVEPLEETVDLEEEARSPINSQTVEPIPEPSADLNSEVADSKSLESLPEETPLQNMSEFNASRTADKTGATGGNQPNRPAPGSSGHGNSSAPASADPKDSTSPLANDPSANDPSANDSSTNDSSTNDSPNDDSGKNRSDGPDDSGSGPPLEGSDPAAQLTTLAGGNPLTGPSSGNTSEQAASLSVIGTEVNVVRDVKDVPPKLLGHNNAIELQPNSLGCDPVDFSRPIQTFRLTIDNKNMLEEVNPLTSDDSAAVACLIQRAGFTFEAGISDGTPTRDDSLLITVEVIESSLGSSTSGGNGGF